MENAKKELNGVKEIAKRAGVSIATVDRVIHNRKGVSEVTKAKIQAIVEELGYQPNVLARSLASRKTLRFAVLIPAVSEETDFWEAPLKGVFRAEIEIKRYGIDIEKYFFDQNDKASFVKQAQKILQNKFDGVLVAPMFIEESIAFTNSCKEQEIPYVFINSDIPNQDSLSYIGPNLYQSGYMGAHLLNYVLKKDAGILVVNISREMGNHHHLLRKEEGFRTYFKDNNIPKEIVKIDIRDTDYQSIRAKLTEVFNTNKNIGAIFVTNSRVLSVARFLLMGYDFLEANVDFLKKNIIDFLICQKPQEQAYRGLMTLYNKLVLSLEIEKTVFMPIDIITRENYAFYNN